MLLDSLPQVGRDPASDRASSAADRVPSAIVMNTGEGSAQGLRHLGLMTGATSSRTSRQSECDRA